MIAGKGLPFFDYNDKEGYLNIGALWDDLLAYFKKAKKSNQKKIFGMPASLGQASGRCFVLHHETTGMFNEVKQGDILITDTTTPEMTPIMAKVAAIVCRELGIPAIVGTKDATGNLRTGDKVSVNADKGEVEIVER